MAILSPTAPPDSRLTGDKWHLNLFGALRAERGELSIDRFRSQRFGALLAYLALYPNRHHNREELADKFWPDHDVESARANVRSALASLRRQLEPPGTVAGSVVASMGRYQVGLAPGSVVTDVQRFEAALAGASHATGAPDEKQRHLEEAAALYVGPLLPGFYEEWILGERDRLAAAYLRVLRELSGLHEAQGNFDLALDYARREVIADPLREDAHAELIRLLMRTEQKAAAQRHFGELERVLSEQLGIEPTKQTRALLLATPEPLPPVRLRVSEPKVAPQPTAAPIAVPTAQAPASAPTPPLRLPLTVARFFGREDEIDALGALLRRSTTRLVTVTGPGGSGKTRLTIETARVQAGGGGDVPPDAGPMFAGGVYFVPLADVREPERIPAVIAGVLGMDLEPSEPPLTQVISALSALPGRVLLLLDNAEHLVEDMARIVQGMLEGVDGLTCLVSSRQRLLLEAEHEFPLLPMTTPRYPGSPERLMEFACVQLFVSRAQAARTDFQLSVHNADAIAALCTRLEGIPLAIELAAAWSRTLTPQQMLERMDQRFDLLISRRRDISPRHRSLRATIETSMELLTDDLRRFFYCLSVFRGGWTLDAAEAVSQSRDTLDFLAQLQEHSLVQTANATTTDDGGQPEIRFHLLETLREFAAEQLGPGEQAELATRHAKVFDDLMEQGAGQLFTADQAVWIQRLSVENDNLLAMLDTYDSPDGATSGVRIIGRMWRYWSMRGDISEGRRRFTRALARADENTPRPFHARARYGAGVLAQQQGDYAVAIDYAREALAMWEAEGHIGGVGDLLTHLAIIELNQAHYAEALDYLQQGLVQYRKLDDPERIAVSLNNIGACLQEWGKIEEARPYMEECLPLTRSTGMVHLEASVLFNLGTAHHEQKNWEIARRFYEQSVQIDRESNDKYLMSRALEQLGTLAYDQGDLDGSIPFLAESLALRRECQDLAGITDTQLAYGHLFVAQADFPQARAAFAEALQVAQRLGTERRIACGLEGMARLAGAQGKNDTAARIWGSASALRTASATPLSPAEQEQIDGFYAPVRAALGDAAFDAAWQIGQTMPVDAACTFALGNV